MGKMGKVYIDLSKGHHSNVWHNISSLCCFQFFVSCSNYVNLLSLLLFQKKKEKETSLYSAFYNFLSSYAHANLIHKINSAFFFSDVVVVTLAFPGFKTEP